MMPTKALPRRMNRAPMATRTAPRNITAWKVRLASTEASAAPRMTAAMAAKEMVSPRDVMRSPPTPTGRGIRETLGKPLDQRFPWFRGFRGSSGGRSLVRPPSERGFVLAEAVGLVVEVAHVGGG